MLDQIPVVEEGGMHAAIVIVAGTEERRDACMVRALDFKALMTTRTFLC